MSLQQQIQQEMQQEARIDKAIDAIVKRFIKCNKHFKRTFIYDEAIIFLVFKISDLTRYHMFIKDNEISLRDYTDGYRIVYLKHSNTRDKKNASFSLKSFGWASLHI